MLFFEFETQKWLDETRRFSGKPIPEESRRWLVSVPPPPKPKQMRIFLSLDSKSWINADSYLSFFEANNNNNNDEFFSHFEENESDETQQVLSCCSLSSMLKVGDLYSPDPSLVVPTYLIHLIEY